jgi:hypothetical protein
MSMRFTPIRLGAVSTLALCLGIVTAVPTLGAGISPAVLVRSWAWVTVRQPAATYVPAALDRGNLVGAGAVTVNHLGVGAYRIDFANAVVAAGGIAHVSTFGVANRVCVSTGYAPVGADIQVSVDCRGPAGAPANATFTVSYLAESGGASPLAYLWADHPGPNPYNANATRSYNATGGVNTVKIMGVGWYRVRLPGLASSDGDMQVTPEIPTGNPRFCEVGSWGPSGGNLVADIRCYKPNGVPANTRFTLSWNKLVGLKGDGGANVAYVLADQPANPGPYVPPVATRYNSSGGGASIVRTAAGQYVVRFPGMPLGGTAIVTPYGAAANRCFVASVMKAALPQQVGVACVNGAGNPADTQFMVSYLR